MIFLPGGGLHRPLDELVKMRSVKSADEISSIKIAQSFVDETFEYITAIEQQFMNQNKGKYN
jgi:hypothetical protein